ncbi:MAG: phage portal protein [Fuerstiella sp.]
MLGWINNFFGRSRNDDDRDDEYGRLRPPARDASLQLRRWSGAKNHQLNKNSFIEVTGRTINSDLHANLRNLIIRCSHVATTIGTIEGMVDSHTLDILGPDGPVILVLPRNPVGMSKAQIKEFTAYQLAAEEYLEEWAACPDVNGEMSFHDILALETRAIWTTGNSFTQIVSKQGQWDKCVGDVRLHPVHAERVLKQYQMQSDDGNHIFLGMELNEYGKALNYYVQETLPYDSSQGSFRASPVPFQQMVHGFKRAEPGQIAGVPLLASSLDDITSLQQFDALTLRAASTAASLGIVFEDAFEQTKATKRAATGRSESIKFNGASLMHAPSGKRAKSVGSEHPASNYVQFRGERWRDIGCPAHMPRLIARSDASGLSYSAARMEQQVYGRGIRRGQQTVKRRYAPTLSDVLREAELSGAIPMRPAQVEIGMSFSALPSADPAKDATTRETDLRTMSKSLLDIWAETGVRPRDQVDKMRRVVGMLNDISPGFGEKYLENLVASTPDSEEAAAMAGHPLPGDDEESDKAAAEIDEIAGEVIEN